MARTQITGKQVSDGTVTRDDLNSTTSGQAVIKKLIAGTNITLSYTGSDIGTGDVTINATATAAAATAEGEEPVYSKRVDFVGAVIYKGEAYVGSPEANAVWRIRQITLSNIDGDVTEIWASGNSNFDKVWLDRLTYIYS